MARLRISRRQLGIVICYHGIAEESADASRDLSPAVARRLFAAQLRHHKRRYDVVPLSDLQAAAARRRRWGRFPLAVTFDDDLRSHVTIALPALRELEVTATFFLAADRESRSLAYWWEPVQAAYEQGVAIAVESLGNASLHAVADAVWHLPATERDALAGELRTRGLAPRADDGLDLDDVAALAAHELVGFHTRGHHVLTALDDDTLDRELERGLDELRAASEQPVDTIAYPHGQADAHVAEAARRHGFRFGVTTEWVPVTPASDPMLLGRVDPSHRSLGDHALRLTRTLARTRA